MATSNGNGNSIPFIRNDDMFNRLKKSMILWYDIAKQGCTNESMAANPKLIDFSGNGNIGICNNFTWSGMSGIGGYKLDFNGVVINGPSTNFTLTKSNTYFKIDFNENYIFGNTIPIILYYNKINWNVNIEHHLKITSSYNSNEEIYLAYYQQTDTTNKRTKIPLNGEIIILPNPNTDGIFILFEISNFSKAGYIKIEEIPLYPNAIVTGGINNYILGTALPKLNKEDGYTIIAKRKWIDYGENDSIFIHNNSFIIEEYLSTEKYRVRSFGNYTELEKFSENDIIYQTSSSYNGINISKGTTVSSLNILNIGRGNSTDYSSIALYSLLFFNRDLANLEIQWVIDNLIN